MIFGVITPSHKLQVGETVIERVAVAVMHKMVGRNWSVLLFPNMAVLAYCAFIDPYNSVALKINVPSAALGGIRKHWIAVALRSGAMFRAVLTMFLGCFSAAINNTNTGCVLLSLKRSRIAVTLHAVVVSATQALTLYENLILAVLNSTVHAPNIGISHRGCQ